MALHQIVTGLIVVLLALIAMALFVSYRILKAYDAIHADQDDWCQGSWE
jgi:multisubunit Na+/H+ antiporter MnhC subunit